MKTRVRDIASRAGVSPATVSNALNGRPGVSQEVTDRIRRLAQEMDYTLPKGRAEADRNYIRLIVYKSHGLVVMDTPFFAELIESIQRECQQAGLELVVNHMHAGRDSNCRERIREYCQENCAGILLLGTEMSAEELALFSPCTAPFVVLDNLFQHEHVHSVVMNNYDAGYMATNALYGYGHRAIEHITSNVSFSNIRYRRKGYEAAMNSHGLPVSPAGLWPVTPTLEGSYRDMLTLLDTGRKVPTAFFAANDIMAVGCMRALAERGYGIPGDVSIIGMDDTSLCLACSPALTTIRVYRRQMGITAVRTLLMLTHDTEDCVLKTQLSVELIERSSVRTIAPQEDQS